MMQLCRPLAAPLRCRALPRPTQSPHHGCSKAASESTSRVTAIGSSTAAQDSRYRDGLPCIVISVVSNSRASLGTGVVSSTKVLSSSREVPTSKRGRANSLSNRNTIGGDSRSGRAVREMLFPMRNVHSGALAAAASYLTTAKKTTGTFTAAVLPMILDNPCTSEHPLCRWRRAFQLRPAGAAQAGAVVADSMNLSSNEVTSRGGITRDVFSLLATTVSAAARRAINTMTKQITHAKGEVAAVAEVPGANKLFATEEEQHSDRAHGVNAEVLSPSQRKEPRWTEGRPVMTAAQAALLGSAFLASEYGTVALRRWRDAARTVQARFVASRCRIQQQQANKHPGALVDSTTVQSMKKVDKIGGNDIIKSRHHACTPPLLCDPACEADGVAAAVCASGFVRTWSTHTRPGRRGHGRSVSAALFIKHFTTSSGNRVKEMNSSEDRSSSGVPGTSVACASSTQKQADPGAAANAPKQEERKPHDKSCDGTQDQSALRPPPRGQRLLGFLATVGACISLVLLYERFLVDSAALLYGAWDSEWDASWRAAAEQYEAELAARGLQLLPPGGEATQAIPTRPPTRQIILVRHGQYHFAATDEERGLTDLGSRQAAATGRRLQQLLQGQHVQAIFHSNLKRARQTAEIIKESGGFKAVPLIEDALLAEGAPAVPVPAIEHFKPSPTEIAVDSQRIEQAFRRYFYRPRCRRPPVTASASADPPSLFSASPVETCAAAAPAKADAGAAADRSAGARGLQWDTLNDSFIILVCHGNVIRYFLMRALQLPACAWLRWALFNTGLTWIGIDAEGRVSCRSFGDVGHLPTHMISCN